MRYLRVTGLIALLGVLMLAAGLVPQPASADDAVVSGATCTRSDLANAISEASDDSTVTFDCDDPLIQFGASEQIVIGAGQTVTIDASNGNGEQIILQGGGDDYYTRFFTVAAGGTLTIQHLTMEDGTLPGTVGDGGAIDVQGGTLNVLASTFRHNTALRNGGAIHSFRGTVTVSQSVFIDSEANYGGAIYQNGIVATLTINESRFEGNSADKNGGALNNNAGSTTIRRSTFVNNEAARGGAIMTWNDSVDTIASTFIDNIAEEAGSTIYVYSLVPTSIRWSTIIQPANTTPAIYLRDHVTLEGVILGGSGQHCEIAGDPIIDSYVLSNDNSCGLADATSQYGPTNLGLGPRSSATINGVEQTFYPLIEGSAAINAAPAAACDTDLQDGPATDQLGTQRPVGSACDIGAIEGLVIVPHSLCANQWSGSLSMARNGDCGRSETLIELPLPNFDALSLCVNNWNGATRVSDNCGRSESPILAYGDGSLDICVNRWTDNIRVSEQCSRSERPDQL